MLTLTSNIESINGVAKRISPKLKKLGAENVADLLEYYPFRWEDWSKVKQISEIEPNTTVTIKGQIELIANKRSQWKKRLITEAIISDETDQVKAVWFHQPYLVKNLRAGDHVYLSGKVDLREDGLQFVHPEYEKITRYKTETMHTARIVPVYPLTKGLTEKQLRYVMSSVISLSSNMPEWLPEDILKKNNLVSLAAAIKQIHFPDSMESLNRSLDRIKFDELFLIQLRAALSREELKKSKSISIKFKQKETKKFVDSLPFQLTDGQKISSWEILKDMSGGVPMNRLVEGDVGSGKTIVAGLAILNAFLNKTQVAYMAPTEILARQHFHSLSDLFSKYKMRIGLLTSAEQKLNTSKDKMTKAKMYKAITEMEVDLVIGTHALIQDKVEFKKLSLVIVDEQHRFGVGQRKLLKERSKGGKVPHLLSMTATPIPRTLALTAYGDLDLSVITEMPKGRKPIKTEVSAPEHRAEKYKFVASEIKAGRQVFVICPLIDPSDKLGVKAVRDEFEKLDKKIFPSIPIGLMHGKLKPKEKESVMQDFLDKKTMIMVSTPVIEVGIDVANATVMIIESAERFGLAQLHQFRGRVGRGEHQSYCFLFSETDSAETMRRLNVVQKSNNGFELAEADLEFRGPGEVYGIKQSGYRDELKVAKLTDYIVIKKSKASVEAIIKIDPELAKFSAIKEKLRKFEASVHFE
jgi:ATP-dependent DNA helicase RecG